MEFVTEAKKAFAIREQTPVKVTDDTSTEVDVDVFPELVAERGMCFSLHTNDDSTSAHELSPLLTDWSSVSKSSTFNECNEGNKTSAFPSKRPRLDDSKLAKETIEDILKCKPGGVEVMQHYKDTGNMSTSKRKEMINILVAHMTEQEGRIPLKATREMYALGIITFFPNLKDPEGKTGYEQYYDAQRGTGFIMNRLKTVQRNTSCKMPSRSNEKTCGPRMEENICLTDQLTGDDCQEAISLLKHSTDRDIIFWKMKETFQYRQEIVKDPKKSTSIFHIFPRFRDTKGLIHQDFALMFGLETASRFLEKWNTSFKENVIKEAKTLNPSAFLLQLLKSAEKNNGDNSNEEWDSDIASLLLLLHLLAPQPSGRKRATKISVRDAVGRLLKFEKSCRSLEDHLSEVEDRQPYLLATGQTKADVLQFYIVVDKNLIPCQASTSLGAFDELFKAHFVFGAQYDPSLSNMFTFIQTTVYKIHPSMSSQSSRTRELRAKVLNG